MSKDTDLFIKEGLQRYKQATNTYFAFRRNLQDKLQTILKKRKKWGRLKPDFRSLKSTTYGQDYPLLNARVSCKLDKDILNLVIGVNWFQSESDFPFFTVWLEKDGNYFNKQEQFNWKPPYKYEENSLRYFPDPDNYDLDKDFDLLLDEFIRAFEE